MVRGSAPVGRCARREPAPRPVPDARDRRAAAAGDALGVRGEVGRRAGARRGRGRAGARCARGPATTSPARYPELRGRRPRAGRAARRRGGRVRRARPAGLRAAAGADARARPVRALRARARRWRSCVFDVLHVGDRLAARRCRTTSGAPCWTRSGSTAAAGRCRRRSRPTAQALLEAPGSRGSRAWSPSGATARTCPAGAATTGSRSRTCAGRARSSSAGRAARAAARGSSARCCSRCRAPAGLVFAGHVGTGFSAAVLRQLGALLRRWRRTRPRLRGAARARPRWPAGCGPELVVEVEFTGVDAGRAAAAPVVQGAARRPARPARWCASEQP